MWRGFAFGSVQERAKLHPFLVRRDSFPLTGGRLSSRAGVRSRAHA